jgi:hypothetical protein
MIHKFVRNETTKRENFGVATSILWNVSVQLPWLPGTGKRSLNFLPTNLSYHLSQKNRKSFLEGIMSECS